MSMYCFTTIIVGYVWLAGTPQRDPNTVIQDEHFIAKSFSFFTFLTFWSLAFHSAISAFHALHYARSLSRNGNKAGRYLQRSVDYHWIFQLTYHVWHTTITKCPFLFTIVFLATMYGSPWPMSRFQQWIKNLCAWLEQPLRHHPCCAAPPVPYFSHLLTEFTFLSLYLGLAYLSKTAADF
ncbi:hypothetical protein DOTSEDRAFT_19616 [Dothistroma septosporum NZE10]|uniref:Uncharacterized protein n=1 Tax=Dothistroma septosporum (strain NZE10 / CBS 128990) TaxID=675120 RepID=N1Q3X5_DOTSN|nr:hypothetical protein DOTSEDRAFT_19616 [Dothistroma septosporum NZE10]